MLNTQNPKSNTDLTWFYLYVPGQSERRPLFATCNYMYIYCTILHFALWPCVGPRIDSVIKCVLSGGDLLSIVLCCRVCSGQRSEASSCVALLAVPGAGRLSRPADSLSRCSSTVRRCHCSNPPLLCPAPLSTSLPNPSALLFLCRCWEGSPLDTTQWQNNPPIYISISPLIYLFSWVFLECCLLWFTNNGLKLLFIVYLI